VFAGQRAEGFYVDLGTVFDLGNLRPFAADHNTFGIMPVLTNMPGVNSTSAVNVHSIAIQVPITSLTIDGSKPTNYKDSKSVLGIYTSASRQTVRMIDGSGKDQFTGPFKQVSRMGNPLFNELLVPISKKDLWNALPPESDSSFAAGVANPELGQLLPVLFTPDGGSTLFPNLAALDKQIAAGTKKRDDLLAILLTGLPDGVAGAFQNNTGTTQADLLRLNVAIPPTTSGPSNLGLVGGDPAGFPNGRRVFDDVAVIELRAVAGLTYALVDTSYTVDGAAKAVYDVTNDPKDVTAAGSVQYLTSFPYLGTPHSGYFTPETTPKAVPPSAP
jgi:hypothetical protein